ncbi:MULTISPECIES: hypothetical protein [Burkholderia]|uniref:DUF2218 domain-containing protein n=2 Tax=Burkholderia cepacia complex TaxID=87882 RepID=A0A318INP7_BURPY|nr:MULTISPECIES: hypothetical protein [Burkholderia]PXX37656.1 hypothetical protein NA66_1004304 [Burkholderia pyrrocinia]CAB3754509.1 hypothetical protein LMG29660_02327 [Burkholderia puraquae]SFW35764.1 hypothetical protein SAMN03159384_01491 [Burkholderia sp. NFACC33-1]SFX90786.1 hypothetical protein SAMN03159408_02572 [Burkholderia sp. NFPP32]
MNIRPLSPEHLESPAELQPAVALRTKLPTLAHSLHGKIRREGDARALLVEIDGVAFAFVSYDSDPEVVHVFVPDSLARRKSHFESVLKALPVRNVEAGWWKRRDQQDWPGNDARSFVIGGSGAVSAH